MLLGDFLNSFKDASLLDQDVSDLYTFTHRIAKEPKDLFREIDVVSLQVVVHLIDYVKLWLKDLVNIIVSAIG
jgi:hypothetical protein